MARNEGVPEGSVSLVLTRRARSMDHFMPFGAGRQRTMNVWVDCAPPAAARNRPAANVTPIVFPVILSGGAGSRLWPLSRELHPKQLTALLDEHTLLQATARRLESLAGDPVRAPIVVANEAHRFMVAEQLEAVGVAPSSILLEPAGRNTAPAIAAAALEALGRDASGEEPVLLVLPADHVIRDEARFAEAVRHAVGESARGTIALLGVVPTYPETGYGYIMAGGPAATGSGARVVERFVEKPDAAAAAAWIEAGSCFWNSGMFVFGAERYLRDLGVHAPAILEAVKGAHERAAADLGFLRLDAECFTRSPAISVDHAVMEHTADAVVVPLDAGWSDVGSWASLAELCEGDEAGNAAEGDAILHDARNTFVRAGDRLVAAVGVSDLVVVDTPDAVLVAGKRSAQDVKRVVERLEAASRDEHRTHRKVYRPWGSYDAVRGGEGFKVKHIVVRPGGRLSLQSHRHRAEHWVVVRGVARVTRGEETFTLEANQSTYIPKGVRHRLENPGPAPLEIIEVQTGGYLDEDDIVRFDDAYGRAAGRSTPVDPARRGSSG